VLLDAQGFVKTGTDLAPEEVAAARWPLARRTHQFETSPPRVFAVGDIRCRSMKRVASTVGEGSAAVQPSTESWRSETRARAGFPAVQRADDGRLQLSGVSSAVNVAHRSSNTSVRRVPLT